MEMQKTDPFVRVILWNLPGESERLTKPVIRKIVECVGKTATIDQGKIFIKSMVPLLRKSPDGSCSTPGVEILWDVDRSAHIRSKVLKNVLWTVKKELHVEDVLAYPEVPPPKSLAQNLEDCLRAGLEWALSPFTLMGNILEKT